MYITTYTHVEYMYITSQHILMLSICTSHICIHSTVLHKIEPPT